VPGSTIGRRFRWTVRIAVTALLLFIVLVATPLLLTTRLANLVLRHFVPDNRAYIGSASLSLTGTLTLHDVVIFDFGERRRGSRWPRLARSIRDSAGEICSRAGLARFGSTR
jgi:hypothetical protein